jgi:hypothetical protein
MRSFWVTVVGTDDHNTPTHTITLQPIAVGTPDDPSTPHNTNTFATNAQQHAAINQIRARTAPFKLQHSLAINIHSRIKHRHSADRLRNHSCQRGHDTGHYYTQA